MFKPGRKSKQFFQFLFPNYIQIFKKMTEDDENISLAISTVN